MGRPREFDTDVVLRQIIEVFWEYGFDKTSFSQIEKATGLKKASLFAAYGDKRALFLHALKQYQEDALEEFTGECAERSSASCILERWLMRAGGCAKGCASGRGCFVLNTLVQTAPHDRVCAHLISQHRDELESMLEKVIAKGVRSGEFRRTLEPRPAARFVLCVASGLQALDRTTERDRTRREITKSAFEFTIRSFG